MSYIGNQPTNVAFVTDTFSGNGSTTAFTMSVAPATTSSVLVAVTGVLQDPSTYSVSGTTLTFSAAPPTGTGNISCRYLGIPASGVTTTAYRTVTEFTATAGQTSFSTPSYTPGFINVYRNGVLLGSADYTATTGTTVVLAIGATVGDLITTESFYVSSVLNAIPATAGSVSDSYISAVSASKLTGSRTLPNGTLPAGTVIQVVNSTVTGFVASTSATLADTGLTASITPTSATSKILVLVNISGVSKTANNTAVRLVLLRGASIVCAFEGLSAWTNAASAASGTGSTNYLDSPATTSSTTYKVQFSNEDAVGTVYVHNAGTGASTVSTMTLLEIAA